MFHSLFFAGWYYLVKNGSTVVYKDVRGEVIASKDQNVIDRIASELNKQLERKQERINAERAAGLDV